ncbi:MAG: ATP-binding cassette domain-containing protein [Pseudomonadales bacterium]|nr:ATP-binding cassette domain-containing protein [Pseudomonadales bacterium]
MITIDNLTKKFGGHTAVNGLSFNVQPGEVLGFLGPNGAGKSTTMKMITGFLTPTSGKITLFDKDNQHHPIACKTMIGYLPEGAPCYGDMTVREFLRFIGKVRGLSGTVLDRRIQQVVATLQLEKVLTQSIETLSKGFKRRVGLAQAILHDPKVLILDEPTDGLDPNQKHEVRKLIQNLSKDKIVIVSTHILEEVSAVCSRAIIIANGQILADGTPEELQTRSRFHGAVRLDFAESIQAKEAIEALDQVDSVETQADGHTLMVFPKKGETLFSAINQLIQEKHWQVRELHVERGRLDEVFRDITCRQSSTQAVA